MGSRARKTTGDLSKLVHTKSRAAVQRYQLNSNFSLFSLAIHFDNKPLFTLGRFDMSNRMSNRSLLLATLPSETVRHHKVSVALLLATSGVNSIYICV